MTERDIFIVALQKDDPAGRRAYLDEACGGRPDLRKQVESLLLLHEGAGSFLENPADRPAATGAFQEAAEQAASRESPGAVIGPYKLVQQIGEGGMGTVWMAQQTEPVKRLVAVKLIKAGMDSRQVVARFEAERQALALMDHPNIARVLDAGTTAAGRPYFVMDLVKGLPITRYCDDNRLSPRRRLELFVPVCRAVQHAHQKGVIHRDLKPSNVLVALHDGKPVPKVIDFGVAKATGQTLTDKTLVTGFGVVVGTLEYMSPEQAEVNQLDVDTRSDVYSLGVLLYELLAGSPPFTRKELEAAGMVEMLRVIREQEPSKPSTRLSTADGLPTLAANRGTEPAKLTRLVRGDLDWIVMKALEKDRNRRYETANGFAADVQRYLADEPVRACPPSRGYRLRKFVRRNRGPVLAAGVVLLTLAGGIVGTTWGLVRAERARRAEAERAEGELRAKEQAVAAAAAEKTAKETAVAREAQTRAVLDFVENKVFAAARPKGQDGGLGHDVQLRRALEAALPFVEQSFATQPLIEALLRSTLGISFKYLGEAKIAAEQFERARRIQAKHLGPDDPATLKSMNNLANTYGDLGRHAEAVKLHEETLTLVKAKRGPDHPQTLISMNNLAISYAAVGRHAEAVKLHEETLALRNSKLGPDHPQTLATKHNLANRYAHLGRHAEALKLREETLAVRKVKLGPDHPDTLKSMNNLAETYFLLGRYAEARKLYEETLAAGIASLGPEHPDTVMNMMGLAWLLAACPDPNVRDAGRAVELARKAVALAPKEGNYWNTLGVAHYRAGDWKAAVAALDRSVELRNGGDIYDWLFLAMAHRQLGENDEARTWYDRAVAWMDKNRSRHEELRRFREEAAKLLKLDEQPKPVPQSK